MNLLPWQEEALQLLQRHDRVSIRSGHGVGKSRLLACYALWYLFCHGNSKIAVTAPTARQMYDVFWSELRLVHGAMEPAFRSEITIFHDRAVPVGSPDAFITARTARPEQPEAFQGLHAKNIAFLIDEASGVDEAIYRASEGSLSTPGAKVLLASNPLRRSGYFADTFRNPDWANLAVSCIGNPLVSADYIGYMARSYGEQSDLYRMRVLGEFPSGDIDAVIPEAWIDAAIGREIDGSSYEPVWGLDVARYGDALCALCRRQGPVVTDPVETWGKLDTMQTAGRVVERYEDTRSGNRPRAIYVDSIGVGAGVCDRLIQLGLPAHAVNVAEAPAVREKFINLRAELWFEARKWFESRSCSLARDPLLQSQLANVLYAYTGSGKLQIESKIQMQRRGVASPDLAESFILTFAGGRDVFRELERKRNRYESGSPRGHSWMAS